MGDPGLRRPTAAIWRDYVALTKPRVLLLLLLTTLTAMLIAGDPRPTGATVALTMLGGYLAAGGASAINCYLDRDIDGVMYTARRRPLPDGRIAPRRALWFGLALSVASFVVFWRGVNLLAALLALVGLLHYVFVYTRWLKRRSTWNIVVGGAAGAISPLVGWAAVTGTIAPMALILFAIVYYWTPPHFWTLALVRTEQYARARVPMLPVVVGERATVRRIGRYLAAMVAISLAPVPLGYLGPGYGVAAGVLAALYGYLFAGVVRRSSEPRLWRLYTYSLFYLALLLVSMVADRGLVR